MRLVDHGRSKKNMYYKDFDSKHKAIEWLLENEFERMPNSPYPDMQSENFFRKKDGSVSVMGWEHTPYF